MTVDANEHSKEQRLNARIECLEKKVEVLLTPFITPAQNAAETGPEILRAFGQIVNEYNENIRGIAEVARLLRELENE